MLAFELLAHEPPHRALLAAPGMPGTLTREQFVHAVVHEDVRPDFPFGGGSSSTTTELASGETAEGRTHCDHALQDRSLQQRVELEALIRTCWTTEPDDRPVFAEIHRSLLALLPVPVPVPVQGHGQARGKTVATAAATTTTTTTAAPSRSSASAASDQGRRPTMEDTTLLYKPPGGRFVVGAVFDGHGGPRVAERGAELVFELARESIGDDLGSQGPPTPAPPAPHELIREAAARIREEGPWGMEGSTATVVVSSADEIAVAWLGDSNAVVCLLEEVRVVEEDAEAGKVGRQGVNRGRASGSGSGDENDNCNKRSDYVVHWVTASHSPNRDDERARIEACGGQVGRLMRMLDDGNEYPYGPWRVTTGGGKGGLAVSRALGDCALREAVSDDAEVHAIAIPTRSQWGKRIEGGRDRRGDENGNISLTSLPRWGRGFVVVASDGLWDALTPQDACDLVGSLPSTATVDDACEALVSEALERGSQDNVAVVLLVDL